jgi:nucleoside-diphosphate-sugar epimerase
MKVLVTGAGGFIGSHVVRRALKGKHQVVAVVRSGSSDKRLAGLRQQVEIVECDLRDHPRLKEVVLSTRPEVAIHLAWYVVPGKNYSAPVNLDCVAASLALAQCLAAAGCPRLVGVGTFAEYEWHHGFLSEDITPLQSSSLYGVSKNATREILEAYCKVAAMSFAWPRLFNVYGPGDVEPRLVPAVVKDLLQGNRAECSHGLQMRDFLYVEDVADALWRVAESNFSGAINIGSGEPVRVRDIVEALGRLTGKADLLGIGVRPTGPDEPPLVVADVRKLKKLTGWAPVWSLEDGLRQTVDWWRGELALA